MANVDGDSGNGNIVPKILTMQWPRLEWRGDGQKRALTCGTLLHIIGVGSGPWDEDDIPGMPVTDVVRELRRVAAKYDPNRDASLEDKVIRGGDMLITDTDQVAKILGMLCDVSHVLRVVDLNDSSERDDVAEGARSHADAPGVVSRYDVTTESAEGDLAPRRPELVVKLTQKGQERLTAISLLAQSDKRFNHIDFGDPILEYNPVLDVGAPEDESTAEKQERERMLKAENDLKDSILPKRRKSAARPTYRSWMWIVKSSPLTFAYATSRTPVDEILTAQNTAPGEKNEKCATLLAQALYIRPFLDLVLSGGPEGIWTGKPIQPHSIHHDVESFTAADRSGFDEETVKMSSLAWEIFEASDVSSSEFKDITIAMKRAAEKRATVDAIEAVAIADEIEADDPRKTDGFERIKKIQYNGTLMRMTDPELHHAHKIVLKTTADALMDALTENGVGPNPADLALNDWRRMAGTAGSAELTPRVRCSHRKGTGTQCKYWSVGGTGKCELHGGRLIDEDETRSLLRARQVAIFAASGKALDTVLYLMEHSANDAIRLRAAETVLNRAGLSEKAEINLDVGIGPKEDTFRQDPGAVVRERLERLARAVSPLPAVDAEVVSEVTHDENDDVDDQ